MAFRLVVHTAGRFGAFPFSLALDNIASYYGRFGRVIFSGVFCQHFADFGRKGDILAHGFGFQWFVVGIVFHFARSYHCKMCMQWVFNAHLNYLS